jgi:chemotaxis protein methyltransferase CheR
VYKRQGIYRSDQVDKIPPDLLLKYFQPAVGEYQGLYQIKREVRALVQFRQLNLTLLNWNIRPGFDVVFCRNVMIYFEKDLQLQILNRFAPLMNPKGLLYAGHSENFSMARDYFTLQGKTIYEVRPEKASKPSVLSNFKKGQS